MSSPLQDRCRIQTRGTDKSNTPLIGDIGCDDGSFGPDPCGSSSEPADGEHTRGQAVTAVAFIRHYVAGAVLTITVVRLVYL